MTGAMGYKPEKPKKGPVTRTPIASFPDRSGNGWMAS